MSPDYNGDIIFGIALSLLFTRWVDKHPRWRGLADNLAVLGCFVWTAALIWSNWRWQQLLLSVGDR